MVTKLHKSKAKRAMDTFFLKVKTEAMLTPNQGTSVANYIYNSFTLSPVNVGTLSYWSNKEFNLYRIQYDKFRVNTVTVQVVPKSNVLDQTKGQDASLFNVNGDGCWHTVIDRIPPLPAILPPYLAILLIKNLIIRSLGLAHIVLSIQREYGLTVSLLRILSWIVLLDYKEE